ncbi:hypothetical protein [Salinigranum sp. GCM10025319]|uniref:hypothetical protein n=1 Tax=Salinigranum sp. GCM10025319 TaxID=3252687 RepID=UPI0036176699
MSTKNNAGAEGKLRFTSIEDLDERVEHRLKRKYGRGIYIENYNQTSDGAVFIRLGNSAPKDVSDSREHDRVLKFIKYEPVYTLEAEPVGNGYLIELPERKEVYEGFEERKRKLARRLDRSMAKTIYSQLVEFPSVLNQLAPISEILRTVREESPIETETIHLIRGTDTETRDKTSDYLRLLEDTSFIRIDENDLIRQDTNLDAHDEVEVGTREFSKIVLGHVIDEAYSTLKDELNITLLAHYPKYANSYYFTPLQRGNPKVRLDREAATENLKSVYDEDQHPIKVRQKLDDLAEVGVIQSEGEFYYSDPTVFEGFRQQAGV